MVGFTDRKESTMACNCGYWWADLDENGTPISLEYCHFDGPDEWAPCVQNEYNEYANEADIEAREAEEEAAYEAWLESLPMEQHQLMRRNM